MSSEERLNKLSGAGSLLLTFLACMVSILTESYYMHALFVVWLAMLLAYFGFFKQSVQYIFIYVFTTFWLLVVVPKGILIISPMLLGMIYKFIVPIMAAYLTFKIPSGKLIAVFQKSSIPQSILLILVVIIRFVPTISGEIKTIKEAMKVRGFMGSKINVVLHPLRTMEYIVVPLIFRSIKVGDELAAAAIVRGIENPGKKQSYYETKLSKTDYVILGISLLLLIICII
ncbi:energy-coupling factor transporter transmembrane component T family protein [Streptococcus agalactiae]